ncbi:MAG: RNA pseudouridine synthase, partial [Bacteroidota bacterium]|nr:RNA pseudouridine synthase [Bacteroidota bacterium]
HQIRIHLAIQKAPITGDVIYGGKPFLLSRIKRDYKLKKGTDEEPFMKRMALHAFSLRFSDIADRAQIIEAPYPKDFQALMRQLTLNS